MSSSNLCEQSIQEVETSSVVPTSSRLSDIFDTPRKVKAFPEDECCSAMN